MEKMINCPSCGMAVPETANFCRYCSTKINDTCSYCWVRKKDNYNCGESKCPGYGLAGLEKKEITSFENILTTKQEVTPPIMRETGVIGLDYTKINDFAAAGVLTKRGAKFIFKQHTWICANSADLPHIKFPYMEAVAAGEAEIIDAPEIPPEVIADWVAEQADFYNIPMLVIDDRYYFALIKEELKHIGFTYENKNIKPIWPSDKIKIESIIDSGFRNHNIVYGDSPIMRWYTNNARKVKSKRYGKYKYIENEDSARKTNGFFAFVAAMTEHELLEQLTSGHMDMANQRMERKKDLLGVTKDYLIKKLETESITAQEIAIIPQILELDTHETA